MLRPSSSGETTVSEDGLTITYTPDEPLAPSTTYAVTLDYCRGAPTVSFTTSHYGAPLEASTELEGATFTLSFTGGEMLVGENAGELMNAIFRWPIMVQIVDVGGDQLSVLAGIGLEGVEPVEQNTCARTIEMDGIPTSDLPYVSGRVEDSTFGAYGGEVRFESFDFDTTIAADGQSIGGMRYDATFGVEEIVALLPDFGDVDSLCTLAANLDIPCKPCPSDEALSCIRSLRITSRERASATPWCRLSSRGRTKTATPTPRMRARATPRGHRGGRRQWCATRGSVSVCPAP